METLKKLFTGFSALAIAMTVVTPVQAATFSDTEGHWAGEYIEALVEKGYVSTDHSTYRPDDSLKRAEIVKLAVEVAGGIIPDVADTPSFSDVAKDAWFFDYVETAVALGIIDGSKDKFSPANNVTRDQAIKIIIEALDVPTDLDPNENFSDVQDSDWSHDYITTAVNQCIVDGSKAKFNPSNNVTRGEIAKMIANSMEYGCEDEDTDTDTDTDEDTDTDTDTDTDDNDEDDDDDDDTVVEGDATLEVSISADNPASQTVPKNGTNVQYLVLDFTAGSAEDVEVTGLIVDIKGLGDEQNYDEVKVYDGFEQLGSGKSFSGATQSATLNLSAEAIEVEAGKTKTIVLAIDMSDGISAGDENYLSIGAVDSVTAFGAESGSKAEVAGDFPLQGEIMTIGSIDVGDLKFKEKSISDKDADIGEKDVVVSRFSIEAGNAEDVLVKAATFKNKGTADAEDLSNIRLYYNDVQLGEAVEKMNSNDKVTFDLTGMEDGGWILEDGTSRTLQIKADIVKGIGETVMFEIDEASEDVVAEGLTYGFNVSLNDWDNNGQSATNVVKVNGGDLNFSITSTARDVAPDTDDVEFGIITIENQGEPVTIKDLDLLLQATDAGGTDDLDLTSYITDIKLVDADTGATILGPKDGSKTTDDGNADGKTTDRVEFSDDFFVDTAETIKLKIYADFENTVEKEDKYRFILDMESVEYKGETSGDDFTCDSENTECKPAANPNTQDYTIAEAEITFTGKTIAQQVYVKDAEQITLWEGTVRANDAEDLVIRELVFLQATDTPADGEESTADKDMNNIENLALYVGDKTEETGVALVNGSGNNGSVSFSALDDDGTSGIALAAGEELTITLKGDVASTLVDGDSDGNIAAQFALDVDETTVENIDGDDASVTNSADIVSASQKLKDSGSIEITLKTSETPDSTILLAGTGNIEVATFELDAEDEDAKIEDLAILITNVDTGSSLGSDVSNDDDIINKAGLYYSDGAPVLKANGDKAETNSIDSNGKALITSMNLVIDKDEDTVISAYVSLNDISTTSTGVSGMTFKAALSLNEGSNDFSIKGLSSGTEYLTVASSGAQIITDDGGTDTSEKTDNGDDMYVFNNKVIATLSSNQPTTLTTGTKEILKFTLTPSGDNNAFLKSVKVKIDETDADTDTPLNVTAVDLYAGSTKIGSGSESGNEWTIDMASGVGNLEFAGDRYDEISSKGETYIVKVTAANVGTDDVITASLDVNADAPGEDDVTWRDYGTNGENGIDVAWINLGEDQGDISTIENSIDNK